MKKQIILILSILFVIFLASNISALIIESVSTNPTVISPGGKATINLLVKNDFEDDITDFSASLDLKNSVLAPYGSGTDFTSDEIREGKTRDIQFEVIALNDAKPGIYTIPLKFSYLDINDEQKTMDSLISVQIFSEPIIEVTLDEGNLLKGKENSLTLKIVNKGLSNVQFLEIETASSTYFTLLTPKKLYIGNIDSDDYQTADFKFFFKETMPDNVNLPVTIIYKDNTNKEYVENYNINMRVYSQEDAIKLGIISQNNYTVYILGLVIIIVLIIIYRIYRRRKRNKED
jgi:hypothetical protein